MDIDATFICAFCFQQNETVVDPTGGMHQEYVEDCQVCCRPNMLVITVDADGTSAEIIAVPA